MKLNRSRDKNKYFCRNNLFAEAFVNKNTNKYLFGSAAKLQIYFFFKV